MRSGVAAALGLGLLAALISAGCSDLLAPLAGPDLVRCQAGLLPGDLVITELMANPAPEAGTPGEEPPREWIEIHNPTEHPIDLQGVVLATGSEDGEPTTRIMDSVLVAPGQYLVLGSDLPDTGGRVALKCDVIEVDAVVYPAMAPGIALGLSGAVAPDPMANDEAGNWCAATQAFGPGRMGSPGAANEVCPGIPGDPGSGAGGQCDDGGTLREPVVPGPGDVVIVEVMPNPDAVSDTDGEWIELYVAADVDLNGLAVGREPGMPRAVLAGDACLSVSAGSLVLIAASADPADNGGLPAVDHEMALGLVNSGGSLFLGVGELVLDQIEWASSQAGVSLSLDPGALSPEGNDDPESWCASPGDAYGSGDTGTPGAPNPPCAAPPAGDVCRDGDTTRPIVHPEPGAVRITEYMPNPDAVSDTDGEWIELRIDADADLNGLELGKEPGAVLATIEAEPCLRVSAGTHVVLARNTDAAANGGLEGVIAELGFSLTNSGGSLFVGIGGEVLDAVSYSSSTAGVATSLDESDDTTWCPSPAELYGPGSDAGTGDRGTPGALNPACPAPAVMGAANGTD